ncbi:SHOCT domain-containing protein [Streptomyces griseosporeus]|uniref:SHOCT domain-containing protein n=1 Tax=Streptomyces griseosporeus TaxID=1910 RepID=UPI00167F10F7|nr:SHOCT domain-containing protein [Streptomyces griseosporeus]GHF61309.1 hypothetical protein GCM10018783_32960 [Streptomyces griseosporeus]
MPGLLRGIARTAVISGTATAVSNRVSRRQQGRWAAQAAQQSYEQPPQYQQPSYQEPPAAETTTSTPDEMTAKIEQLKQLGELKAQGVLTDAEFQEQKRRLLA